MKAKHVPLCRRQPRVPPSLPTTATLLLLLLFAQGRLDYNTEGLLLLTNDGDLARLMELPSSGIVRTYSVRVYGNVSLLHVSVFAVDHAPWPCPG